MLHPDDAHADDAPKLTYRDGLSRLGKLLAEAADVTLRTETRVGRLVRTSDGWRLSDTGDHVLGTFDAVLLTPPSPQTRDLLTASDLGDGTLRDRLVDALGQAAYTSQFALVLAFDRLLERPTYKGATPYGLVDTSRAFPVARLSFEDDQPGHVPAGQTVRGRPRYAVRPRSPPPRIAAQHAAAGADLDRHAALALRDTHVSRRHRCPRRGR
mgnify:CR=1 FL=1